MFLLLLISSTLVALGAALLTVRFFDAAILRILHTILGAELASAWQRYLRFAIVVVGVSGGVRPLDLEKYIAPNRPGATAPELSLERWTLELYRSLIDSLQSIAWMLLLFFIGAMIAHVLLRTVARRRSQVATLDDEA